MKNLIPFELLVPDDRRLERRQLLAEQPLTPTLSSHKEAAKHYQPGDELVDAVNVALSVGASLLLTGEPGTGKTQVAHYLAWYFHLGDDNPYELHVRSNTTAEDLLYRFDYVAYLHAATSRKGEVELPKEPFIDPGPLWRAYEADGPSIVLIDEIDKAPRDFPNDLLNILDQHRFEVKETSQFVERRGRRPPLVVITSNSERRLPEPFLRRCIFHHIEFTEDLVRRAVQAREGDFPHLSSELCELAIERFLEIREVELRKRPATAELLIWLTILSARRDVGVEDLQRSLALLPSISALIKDREDLELLS